MSDVPKRAFDVTLAGVGLFLSLPLWIAIAIAVKLDDRGPIFYGQHRVGHHGRPFKSWKFRTMVADADATFGPRQASGGDARITRVGRLLRSAALDELPQLWNIFKGDMSFVGPRPLMLQEIEVNGSGESVPLANIPGYRARHAIIPGLTGIAQVYAARDVPRRQKFRYDRIYVRRRSFCLDLRLIALSFRITFQRKWDERGRKRHDGNLPPAPPSIRMARWLIRRLPLGRSRLAQWWCRRRLPVFSAVMPANLGALEFECDLRDAISRDVCLLGLYEPQETLIIQKLLKEGMTFVDVGANWGYFTLIAARAVGTTGRVLCLEPDPRLARRLEANIRRNRLTNVTALQVAAADRAGTMLLEGYNEHAGNVGPSKLVAGAHPTRVSTFEVRVERLDSILQEYGIAGVDVLKMDIEGAESFAIAGLRAALSKGVVKRLLIELHPAEIAQHGSSPAALIHQLLAAGYCGFTIDQSPSVTRRLAYGGVVPIDTLIRPIDDFRALDMWPHQLWVAPGVEAL